MKYSFLILLFFMSEMTAQIQPLFSQLSESYPKYREQTIHQRVFTASAFREVLLKKVKTPLYTVSQAGTSFNGTPVYLIQAGTGAKKVFLWSQMHGDEPTATQALLDFFNFLNDTTAFAELRNLLLTKLTIYIMPMVNPDGADAVSRRNAQEIDINRDIIRLQTPEGRMLLETFNTIKPDFGFNLHDQNPRYSVGNTDKTAALSFLAPAPDPGKSISPNRADAMRLIGLLTKALHDYIPGYIGRYDDEHEPRAFGDKFQALGAATILIESGGRKDDPEKQYLRKMNFLAFVGSLYAIALDLYREVSLAEYEAIPFNQKNHFDIIIRNAFVERGDTVMTADIAINRNERVNAAKTGYVFSGVIEDYGHLLGLYGIEELDATGLKAEPGRVYSLPEGEKLSGLNTDRLYRQGITTIEISGTLPETPSDYPFTIRAAGTAGSRREIHIGRTADFSLTRNGKVEYIIVNGVLRKVL